MYAAAGYTETSSPPGNYWDSQALPLSMGLYRGLSSPLPPSSGLEDPSVRYHLADPWSYATQYPGDDLAFHIHDVRQAVAVPMLRVESIGDVIRHYEIHNPPFVVKHSWRTADLAEQIGRYLGMDRSQLELTRLSALLHDWKYPFDFCSDPSFTDEQYQLFKLHPWAGFTAQIEAAKATGDPRLVSSAYGAALHHARRQGISYPQVPGDAIPVIFGAVGAADVFDALRNPRPNHDPFHPEHVYDIFRNGDRRTDPREFDPRVYQAMMANFWDLIKRHDQLKKPGMMQ